MKKFDSINVIPLIDVMLVLLAIVLTTASFIVHDSMKLDLPETESTKQYTPSDAPSKQLVINEKGELFVDDQPVSYAQFKQDAADIDPQTQLVVEVDKKAQFGEFIKLVDILKQHKLTQLTFLTKNASE